MTLTETAAARLTQMLAERPPQTVEDLNKAFRLLAKWRSQVIANSQIRYNGLEVMQGPFAGMTYLDDAAEGALAPRLIGTYESELHPYLTAFIAEGLDCVIDVGCAEGYYAVGLARMDPGLTVHAFDIDEKARIACGKLAALNGVEDRVRIGGEFKPDGFEAFKGQKCLVLVDAEGAELEVLQPALSPSLAQMNIIVETHDIYRPGALNEMMTRFSPTHDIIRVDQQGKTQPLPGWMAKLGHLDHLLAVWEWRTEPTPWLVMRPKVS
jgi:hypothetical protein